MKVRERGIKPLPGGRYLVTDYHGGQAVRQIVENKTQAMELKAKLRLRTYEQKYFGRKEIPRVHFEEAVEAFLQWSKVSVRPRTHEIDLWASNEWLSFDRFAGKTIDAITLRDVEAFREKLLTREGRPLSKRSVDIMLSRLKKMTNLYIRDWRVFPDLELAHLKLFHEDVQRTRWLTEAEEARLMKALSRRLQRIVIFALHTGMRRGEILGLRWSDVDLAGGMVTIPGARAKGKRDRHIPLNEVAQAILRDSPRPIRASGLVFGNAEGKPDQNFERAWGRAVKKAGVADFRFHDLRHTFASRLAMTGQVQQRDLMELLGHHSGRMTERYTHLQAGYLRSRVDLLAGQNPHFFNREGPKALPAEGPDGAEPIEKAG